MSENDIPETRAGAILAIDLDAVQANYRILRNRLGGVRSAAVVKADGYGLGAAAVGPALAATGCAVFFVAHLNEGVALRAVLPDKEIHILNGVMPNALDVYAKYNLIPVLGSLGDIETWRDYCGDTPLPCDIHVDTGMLRLGLPPSELAVLEAEPDRLQGLNVRNVMSHLASADEADARKNGLQLAAFRKARLVLPMGQASFANSSGIFLGEDYHFDLARPGVALYGINPTPDQPNPMTNVITLKARILQIRNAEPGDTVGYGGSFRVNCRSRIATVPVGYADGYLRSLSGRASGMIDGIPVPLVGRVSMDLITFDVSAVPEARCQPGQWITLIGPDNPVDTLAAAAGTIGYEILTRLGGRYHRVYTGGTA